MNKITLLVSCLLLLGVCTAWAEGVDDLPKSDSYGGTIDSASTFNLIAGADFTLEVTGTAGQEIRIAGGLIKYTPEADGTVRFASASGVVYVFEGSTYKGTVAVDASAVRFPDIFSEPNVAGNQAGIYNPKNLLQNPGFETIPNDVWLAYNADDASVAITTVSSSGTSIRAHTTMEGANALLLHGGAKYFTQSLSAGTIAPNTYYKIAYKYKVNAVGSQGGAVVRAQFGTAEKASDIVTTPTHTTPTDNTSVQDVIEVITTGSSVDTINPVWFTVERTEGTGTGNAQKLEYYDNLTLVRGTLSTGIENGGDSVTYLSGTAYAPAAAFLSDLQVDGVTVAGFSVATNTYTYYLAPGTTAATVSATAASDAATVVVTPADQIPGDAEITVTPGNNGDPKTYTVHFAVNYIYGWDGNGVDTTVDIPSDFGWARSGESVTWAAASSTDNYAYRYRDNLGNGVGRVLTHPVDNNVFSFPVPLTGRKIYHFTCRNSNMNSGTVSTLFGINTSSDATGTMLNSQTQTSAYWAALTTFDFNFAAPEDGTYYMVWQTTNGYDRNMATDFLITLLGDALAVTFDTDGGTAIAAQYFQDGESYTITQPVVNPEKEGFIFEGWYTENTYATAYDFSTPVTADITIYAKWSNINYISGWDGNGIGTIADIPSDFGWVCSDESVTWAAADGDNYAYRYRDDLNNGVGRVLTHPANDNVFSFPVPLTGRKIYRFTCRNSNMDNETVSTLFGINTSSDATGTMLNSQSETSAQYPDFTKFEFDFTVPEPEDSTYYMVWQTTNGNNRNMATDFRITLLGDALAVTFDTDGGTAIDAQYFPDGESYTITQPGDPEKEGFIFDGWYTERTYATAYDFSTPVTADITIYAKWSNIKGELETLIATATGLLSGGTEAGTAYLSAAITDAQAVYDNYEATIEVLTNAYNTLTAAIASCRDASLSGLQVNGAAISGFSATIYDYTYYLAPGTTEATVSATAAGDAATVVVTQADQIPGDAAITVTPGNNGDPKTYTVHFAVNYLHGWNDNSDPESTPNTIGWDVPSGTTVAWGHENSNNSFRTNASNTMLYIVDLSTVFSYPVTVPAKKIYQLTGNIWHREGGEASNCIYSFDLADSREGDNIYSQANTTVSGHGAYVSYTGRLSVPADITDVYFRLSGSQNEGYWGHSGFVDLLLLELGDALAVTFDLGEAATTVAPQSLLAGAGELAVQPADPVGEGYNIFKGWYTERTYATAYDFSTPVTADITIYAKWSNIKEELETLIATATGLLSGGTEAGTAYLSAAITDAQAVYDNYEATVEALINAYNTLTAAIASCRDASLSGLQVNGAAISGFSATIYDYTYYLAPGTTEATVSATAAGDAAATVVVTQADQIPGDAAITVTPGNNGDPKTYTVHFAVNYLYGWNDNSDPESTPNTIGWDVPSCTTVAWGHENSNNSFRTNASNAMLYIVDQNTVFSYPVTVPAKKIYQLTGNIWHRNGGEDSNCIYSFDLAGSREGDNIYSQANTTVTGHGAYVSCTGRLSVPADITDVYFRLSASQNEGYWDNSGFVDLLLLELGDALAVTFDSGEAATTVAPQSLLAGAGELAVQPADPVWEGYTFKGWYTENTYTTAYDFSTPVTADITLYAKWDIVTGLNPTVATDAVVSVEYYTLQGQKVAQPVDGIYLVKKTHASNKVSVEKVIYSK